MTALAFDGAEDPLLDLDGARDRILACQRRDGAIPWFEDGPWDPWNHAECLMALDIVGEVEAAERGWAYLAAHQDGDGAWMGEYGNALPMQDRLRMARTTAPAFRDTNFIAYPAVALWRRYRQSGALGDVAPYWPMVRRAIDFVVALQHEDGDIPWSREVFRTVHEDAVRAGNASIYKSLSCALKLGEVMGEPQAHWRAARLKLQVALRQRPDRVDRAGTDRSGFAMDWYYPALSGVLDPDAAAARLEARAGAFIAPGCGCRCVASEPWVTVAESCELAIALVGLGARRRAERLIAWQFRRRDDRGAFWMGWQFEEAIVWPREQPSWTQAAAILAVDALRGLTPASDVLSG